jgi:hypothetical protein
METSWLTHFQEILDNIIDWKDHGHGVSGMELLRNLREVNKRRWQVVSCFFMAMLTYEYTIYMWVLHPVAYIKLYGIATFRN